MTQKLIYLYNRACHSALTRTETLSDFVPDLDNCTYHKVMKLNLDVSIK